MVSPAPLAPELCGIPNAVFAAKMGREKSQRFLAVANPGAALYHRRMIFAPGRAAPTQMPMRILVTGLAILSAGLFIASLQLGPVRLGPHTVLAALGGMGDPVDVLIVQELRLPRAILALVIGATLALSGAALQGLVRNPLAAPSVFGAPSAAAFGAVVAIGTGLADALSYSLPVAAMLGALVSVGALLGLAGPGASMLTLLLAGLALSSFAGAAVSLALNLATNPYAALEIAFWLLGSLEDRSFQHLWMAAPLTALSWVLLLAVRGRLRVLTLGEDVARTSGVDLGRLRLITVIGVAMGVGASVAVAGVIGFVGLVTPHLVRPFVSYDPARVHIPAMLAGSALLLAADCASRLIPSTGEIRIGVLTALIGAPFFIWLVLKQRGRDLLQGTGAP
jgi:iron complex transport system permease protein